MNAAGSGALMLPSGRTPCGARRVRSCPSRSARFRRGERGYGGREGAWGTDRASKGAHRALQAPPARGKKRFFGRSATSDMGLGYGSPASGQGKNGHFLPAVCSFGRGGSESLPLDLFLPSLRFRAEFLRHPPAPSVANTWFGDCGGALEWKLAMNIIVRPPGENPASPRRMLPGERKCERSLEIKEIRRNARENEVVEHSGFEPLTFSLRTRRSTN